MIFDRFSEFQAFSLLSEVQQTTFVYLVQILFAEIQGIGRWALILYLICFVVVFPFLGFYRVDFPGCVNRRISQIMYTQRGKAMS